MITRPRIATLAIALLAASPHAANAQSASANAEALFREGKKLMGEGKTPEACAAFDTSQELQPAVTTLLNQGACREKNRQFATAWGHFVDAERQTRGAEGEEDQQLHDVAAKRAAKLESLVSTLTIEVASTAQLAGLEVRVGSKNIGEGEWNRALPFDGGDYTVVVSAPGHRTWEGTVKVEAELDAKSIAVPALVAVASTSTSTSKRSRKVEYILGASALTLGGVALGAELWSRSTYGKAEREPDDAQQHSLWQSANRQRYVAEGAAVAGALTMTAAIWWHFRGRHDAHESSEETARIQAAPLLTPNAAGVAIQARW